MIQPPSPGSEPSNYPRPNLADDRQVLRDVAVAQRQIMFCVLGQVLVGVLNGVASAGHITVLALVDALVALGVLVLMVMSVSKLAKALKLSSVLYVILMFIPCVSLITLLSLNGKATAHLRQAGIKVGFMGADPNSI